MCSSRKSRAASLVAVALTNTAWAPLVPIFATSPVKLAPGSIVDRVFPGHLDPCPPGVARHDLRERTVEGVLVGEHVEAAHALGPQQGDLRGGLHRVALGNPPERALAGGVEPFGLVLAGVERGGEADVGARRAHLEDAGGVDQRQRDRGGARVVVAEVGDRGGVLRDRLGVGGGDSGVPLAAYGVGVVERDVADRQRADAPAGV